MIALMIAFEFLCTPARIGNNLVAPASIILLTLRGRQENLARLCSAAACSLLHLYTTDAYNEDDTGCTQRTHEWSSTL
jgi:hypothetical protein